MNTWSGYSLLGRDGSNSEVIRPITLANSPSPTLVLRYQKRNLLVPRPASYQEGVSLVRAYIPRPPGDVRFLGRVPQVDEEVEITAHVWSLVIKDVQSLRIEIDSECNSDTEAPPSFSTIVRPSHPAGTPQPIQVTKRSVKGMRINIKPDEGELFSLYVEPSETVDGLKAKIHDTQGTPTNRQTLSYGGVGLNGNLLLSNYNIPPGSTVEMFDFFNLRVKKPVIYIYPPNPMDVQVQLALVPEWQFSAIYPLAPIQHVKQSPSALTKQEVEWNVHAESNGVLTDKRTGSNVAYLYWEAQPRYIPPISPPASRPATPHNVPREAPLSELIPGVSRCEPQDSVLFKAEDVPSYLDRALLALGLHVEARTSFITFWLPDILKHKFIALRFVSQASYERAAPLNINPTPDVVTRVFMLFQGVKEQDTETWTEAMERGKESSSMWTSIVGTDSGKQADEKLFRVLEWGGMECV